MEDKEILEIYKQINAYEKEVVNHNALLIKSFGKTAPSHFKKVIDCVDVTDKIQYVDTPKGDKQNESYGMFKDIHVHQWSIGMEGDSFEGYIYANVNGKWIKVPYSC